MGDIRSGRCTRWFSRRLLRRTLRVTLRVMPTGTPILAPGPTIETPQHTFDSISVRTEPRRLNFHMLHTCTWRIWYVHIWNTITNDRLHSSKKWMVCRSHENGYILLLIHLRRARKIFIAVHHFNIFTSFTLSRCQHGYLLVLIHVQRAREIFLKGNSKIFTGCQNRSTTRVIFRLRSAIHHKAH